MAYRALEEIRKINREKYGIDGPEIPARLDRVRILEKSGDGKGIPRFEEVSELEKYAIDFIRDSCENLRFDKRYMAYSDCEGKSLKPKQIPFNMEKDLDRRCLEVAIHRFLESGRSKDAFDVYFCFFEMFLGEYGKTKKIIEMLSEFETNASSLLMKHRDHYSHSTYVFIMGLAFYQSSPAFREAYKKCYGEFLERQPENLTDSNRGENYVAAHFLKYWGITSLLHDIGYPFELTFEQVKSYFGNTIDYVPFVTFNMNHFVNSKTDDISEKVEKLIKEFSRELSECIICNADTAQLAEGTRKKMVKKTAAVIADMYGSRAAGFGGCGGFECREEEDENKAVIFVEEKIIAPEFLARESYSNAIKFLDAYKKLLEKCKVEDIKRIHKLLPDLEGQNVDNLNLYLADALNKILGDDYADFDSYRKFKSKMESENTVNYRDYLYDVLNGKSNPEKFGGFIDHAYFSAIMLIDCLFDVVETDDLNEMYTNAFTAIIMHNSLYKFSITDYNNNANEENDNEKKGFNVRKHFRMERHPLAFLLMLCDEIQCWDRTSYGKNSRGEVHPVACELSFKENSIEAKYVFDKNQVGLYSNPKGTYAKLSENKEDNSKFLSDIEHIVSINGDRSFDKEPSQIRLLVSRTEREDKRYRSTFLSTSNYIHFYKFAIMVHQMNHIEDISEKNMEEKFAELSLEYKINHISRAKKFARYLNEVGCFYSDKPIDMECVGEFGKDELTEVMGPLEHERWCWEHYLMGWKHGEKYKTVANEFADEKEKKEYVARVRECTKTHCDMPEDITDDAGVYSMKKSLEHFAGMSEENKKKDTNSLNNLLKALRREDGIKIYRLK